MQQRANMNQPVESRISTLETEFQSFAVSTTQRFDSFDARQTAIDGKVGLILDRLASLTAQEDRLPKEFVSQAFNAFLGLAGLIIAVTGAAAGVGAMYVNLQVGRLDRADEYTAEKVALCREVTAAEIEAALGPLRVELAEMRGKATAFAMTETNTY